MSDDEQLCAEQPEDWEATLRYCERQWSDERGAMLDKITALKAELAEVRKSAELAAMYLETGFIECPRCGHEVPTEHTDAEHELRAGAILRPGEDVDQ